MQAAQTALAAVDLADEHIEVVTDAALTVQRLRNRLDADLLRVLAEVDAREGYRHSGASTTAAWFRSRTRVDEGVATGLVKAARRLAGFPALAAQLAAGAVTLAHVQVITRAAIPQRAKALASCEEALVTLALLARPAELRRAVAHIADQVDPDGSANPPPVIDEQGRDVRRELFLRAGLHSLGDLSATLDPIAAEGLRVLLNAMERRDPADTPPHQRRTYAQRQHDAFAELIERMLALPDLPSVHGARPTVTTIADLAQMQASGALDLNELARIAGLDLDQLTIDPHPENDHDRDRKRDGDRNGGGEGGGAGAGGAGRPPLHADDLTSAAQRLLDGPPAPVRFGSGIPVPAYLLERLLAAGPSVLAVLTLGPWRVVNVGAKHRTLPAWLRQALLALHPTCRGPDCDLPATWGEMHHATDWTTSHITDLNDTVPLCRTHHRRCTVDGWRVRIDLRTGDAIWTTPDGTTITVPPPRHRA